MKKKIFIEIFIMLLLIIFAGYLSVKFGVDRAADTRNYHIYNPWAFLNNRISVDIMPADIQSYFNPLLDIPYFLMIKYFNNYPTFVTFIWGSGYALYLFIVFKISEFIFKDYNKIPIIITSVLVASGTEILISRLGWLTHDTLLSGLILISIYLILKSIDKECHYKMLLASGIILGAITGLKYTTGIFTLAIFITILLFYKQFTNPKKSLLFFFSGTFIGFLIFDGFWLIKLFKEFGNPFFPYFNWFFKSNYLNLDNVFSLDFENRSQYFSDLWFYPFHFQPDLRFKILWIIFVLNLFTIPFINKEKFKEIFKINIVYIDFILVFSIISYVIWLYSFAVPRYYGFIMGLAGLVTIGFYLKLLYLLKNLLIFLQEKYKLNIKFDLMKYQNIYLAVILILLFTTLWPKYSLPKSSRLMRTEIGEKLMNIRDANIPNGAIVLVQRGAGMLVPFQNPNARYFYLNARKFTEMGLILLSENVIEKIKMAINENPHKIYFLNYIDTNYYKMVRYNPNLNPMLYELDRLGLNTSTMRCKKLYKLKDKYSFRHIDYSLCKIEIK